MATLEMCADLGKAHEFFLALKKAGFDDELIQNVINSRDNLLAKEMFYFLESKVRKMVLGSIFSKTVLFFGKEKFCFKDDFVVDISDKAKVKISSIDPKFQNWFIAKEEDVLGECVIYGRELKQKACDVDILADLDDEGDEITITEVYAMLKLQPNGEKGKLLTNGRTNIFYVLDDCGCLCTVGVRWDNHGWKILAIPVETMSTRAIGSLIFSHTAA